MKPEAREQRAAFRREMRRKIDLVAAERGLPPSAVAKVRGRLRHHDVMSFVQENAVDVEWLYSGDLRGLARMIVSRSNDGHG